MGAIVQISMVILDAASVVAATELLDTQVKINADAITINTAKASMVLGTSSQLH